MRRPLQAPPLQRGPVQRAMLIKKSNEDKEFEETLEKLKKMSEEK